MKHTRASRFPVLRVLVAVLFIAAIGGGCLFYKNRTSAGASTASAGTYTQVVHVTQGDLSSTLSVVGQLEAEQRASLAFEHMSGAAPLISLTVQAGNTVTQGQVLATIDSAAYQQALDQSKSDLQTAEEALSDLQAPATALERAQADMAVARAQGTLAQAGADLADRNTPDLTALQNTVQDAEDNLKLLEIQDALAQRDALAKSERDLRYSANWYSRRIEQLKALDNLNTEQVQELASAQQKLPQVEADLARVRAERELDSQARAVQIAQARITLAEAQDALAQAQAGSDALAVAQAQLAVSQAEVSLQAAQEARRALDEGADATRLAAAQAAVDKRRLAVSEAEAALAGAELVAPFDGTVLETNVSVGDKVSANTTVLTVANLKNLRVVASVDETSIRQVSTGQTAVITFDAFPGQSFAGQVLAVPLQGALQGDVMVYNVPVSLTGAENLSLLVGMTANVEIRTAEATNVLLVPTMALTQSRGAYQVLVPNTTDPSGEPEAVPVQIGASDGTYTAVLKGLNVGDSVLVEFRASDSGSSTRGIGGGNLLMGLSRRVGG